MLVKVKTINQGVKPTTPARLKIRVIQTHEQDYQKVIDCIMWKTKEGELFINDIDGFQKLLNEGYLPVELIAYSEMDEIAFGDYWYNRETNQIVKCEGEIIPDNFDEFKILAFHHNFTKEHIQQVIDGKLKDGDELDIVCTDSVVGVTTQDDYYISLDTDHKIELSDKPVVEETWDDVLNKFNEDYYSVLIHKNSLRNQFSVFAEWLKEKYNSPKSNKNK